MWLTNSPADFFGGSLYVIFLAMKYLKGVRFGFPAVERLGIIDDRGTRLVKWHSHVGCEIHYVLKGSFAWEFKGREESVTLPGGSFVVVPPHMKHRAVDEIGTPSMRIGLICEPPSAAAAAGTAFSADDLKRTLLRLKKRALMVRDISAQLARILKSVRDEASAFLPEDADGRLRLKILSEMLLIETARALETDDVLSRDGDVIPRIRDWISSHLADEISTAGLIRRSGYGRSRFFSLFLAETGMTPNDYVVRQRVKLAKRLIRETKGAVLIDIAHRCGFKSAPVFSSTFRRHVGMTPSAFYTSLTGRSTKGPSTGS